MFGFFQVELIPALLSALPGKAVEKGLKHVGEKLQIFWNVCSFFAFFKLYVVKFLESVS